MTKEQRSEAYKLSHDGMIDMQDIIDRYPERVPKSEANKLMLWMAKRLYEIYWMLYQILLETRKKGGGQ
jgi:hypothetical protein